MKYLRMVKKALKCQRPDWRIEQSRRNSHWLVLDSEGHLVDTLSNSDSDWRSKKNFAARMKKLGIEVPDHA